MIIRTKLVGKMRTKIRIQKMHKDGTGSFAKEAWIDIGNTAETDPPHFIWAHWVNVHGSEVWAAESVQAQKAATVTIRYRKGIDEQCRIVKDGILYQIVSIDDIKDCHQWIEMKVRAAVNG